MKKIIKGRNLTLKVGCTGEYMSEYVSILKPYFNKIGHHYMENHSLNKDCILAFSYFPNDMNCDYCKQKPITVNIPRITTIIPIKKGFGDTRFRDTPCSRLLKIQYAGSNFGFYCVKNNLMLTSDFAHSDGNQPHVKVILDHLFKMGILINMDNRVGKYEITLGTDPEMEALVDGKYVAGQHLPSIRSNDKVYISHDGARNQRELRPDPSKSPEELVENIRDLIRISSFFGEELSIAGNKYSLGGHIHIGGTDPCNELIELLDYFLYPLNALSGQIRKDSQYGKLGDFRYQPHGFEYRTPPAAWLLTPDLALKTLQLSKVVVESLLNGVEIIISERYGMDEYVENLSQFPICTDEWIKKYLDELEWASHNLDKSLSETWDVSIPKEFKAQKKYQYDPDSNLASPILIRSIPICDESENDDPVCMSVVDEINPETGEPYT